MAVLCPECESSIILNPDELEEGDTIACEDCGAELEIISLEPLKVTLIDDSGYDDPEDPLSVATDEEEED